MSRRVELTPEAEEDLARLGDFLVEKNRRAALAAMRSVRKAIGTLGDLSERGRPVGSDGLRHLVVRVGGGPYLVEYRADPSIVVVAHIWHAKEDRRGVAP